MEIRQRHRWAGKAAAKDRRALTAFALLICLWLFTLVGTAQTSPRNYSISPPHVGYSPDGAVAVVSFTVSNQGGDASEPSQIIVSEYQSGRVATSEQLPPLAAGQTRDFSIQLPLANITADGIISFKIEAGIDEFELAASPIARDNSQLFHIDRSQAGDEGGAARSSESAAASEPNYDLFIPLVNLGVTFLEDGFQLNDSRYASGDIMRAIGMLALALVCLWLLSLILRLIFRRPPKFDVWQPPYAVNNWQDPNSAPARRQGWQFHAQNSAIAPANAPNQVTVVKRLLDRRGVTLGSWKIKAMRTVQYDIYGRINRSEALMPRRIISQLNRVLRRGPSLANHDLLKALSPIAKGLSKYALGPVEKQNLMLPLALDIRFEGITDAIRIQFELYQYGNNAWHLIDQWEPELGQVGEQVPEHFTYSLNGQHSGESKKAFKRRLREDITQLLAELCHQRQVEQDPAPPAEPASLNDLLNYEEPPEDGSPFDDETDPSTLAKR